LKYQSSVYEWLIYRYWPQKSHIGESLHKAQYQKLNANYSFFVQKVQQMIRCIKWSKTL